MTFWGKRTLELWPPLPGDLGRASGFGRQMRRPAAATPPGRNEPDPAETVAFNNAPGSVYMTSLVPVKHQVKYDAESLRSLTPGEDTLQSPDLGEVGVHVIFRTPLFTAGFGQTTRALPNPAPVWEAFNAAFLEWQQTSTLVLPTLAEVEAAPWEAPWQEG